MNDKKPRYKQLSELPSPAHLHMYYVVCGPVTVRYCSTCGKSWLLTQLYGKWYWNEVTEQEPQP